MVSPEKPRPTGIINIEAPVVSGRTRGTIVAKYVYMKLIGQYLPTLTTPTQ
jgi:hypothetical protein